MFEFDEKDNKTVPIRLSYLSVGDKHVSAVMENITYLNATREAEKDWNRKVTELSDKTLFPISDSWYMGANIPGKKREQL